MTRLALAAFWLAIVTGHAVAADRGRPAVEWQKVTLGSGSAAYPFALYASQPLSALSKSIRAVVIIQHGYARNGDVYFADAAKIMERGGVDANTTVLVAPQFFATPDADKVGDASVPLWTTGGWLEGAASVAGTTGVSSFRVYDDLVAGFADRQRFPALERIVFAGHSGGAQIVHRYAALNHIDDSVRAAGIDLRYVIANPSSYLYFTKDRPQGDGFAPYDAARCPNFDAYKYGFEGAVPGAAGEPPMGIFAAYAARDVVYLLGAADDDPNPRVMDKRCPAQAQGLTRIERGRAYVRYEHFLADRRIRLAHRAYEVIGVGHDQDGIFGSRCGLQVVFGAAGAANSNGAQCVDITTRRK